MGRTPMKGGLRHAESLRYANVHDARELPLVLFVLRRLTFADEGKPVSQNARRAFSMDEADVPFSSFKADLRKECMHFGFK